MNSDEKRRTSFPLRLAVSLRDMANIYAHRDGVSLNHFISLAVAEKISRLEHETLSEYHTVAKQQKLTMATGVINKTFFS